MVKTVFSIGLSTGENLVIKKNRLEGTGGCGKGKRNQGYCLNPEKTGNTTADNPGSNQ